MPRQRDAMNSLRSGFLTHAANLLLLAGYTFTDVLRLRVLVAASCLISIPYFYFAAQPTRLWILIAWNAALAGVNLIHSWRLYRQRRAQRIASSREPEVRWTALQKRDRVLGAGGGT